MTTQVRTQESQDGHGRWTPLVLTALMLAVLGAIALWQLRPGDEGAMPPTAEAGGDRAAAGVSPHGEVAERYATQQAAARTTPPTVYTVASQVEAEWLRARLDEGAAVRSELGIPETVVEVVWFPSAAMNEGVPAMGGLAELYRDRERGELSTAPPFGVVALTDGTGNYRTNTDILFDADVDWVAATQMALSGDCVATLGPAHCSAGPWQR